MAKRKELSNAEILVNTMEEIASQIIKSDYITTDNPKEYTYEWSKLMNDSGNYQYNISMNHGGKKIAILKLYINRENTISISVRDSDSEQDIYGNWEWRIFDRDYKDIDRTFINEVVEIINNRLKKLNNIYFID